MSAFEDTGLKNILSDVKKEMMKEVNNAAADLIAKSSQLAPIKDGHLRGDAQILASEEKTTCIDITVGYTLPYALRQHEELTWNHPQGGQAKFLETAFEQNKKMYEQKIQEAIKRGLK